MASGYFTCLKIPPQHWRPRATLFVKATWRTKFSYKDIRYGGGVFVSIAPFGAAWTTTGGPECFGAVACVATDLESKRATLRGGGGASTGASTSAENFVMGLPSVFPPPNEYVDAEPRLSSEHITHTRSQLTGIYLIGHSWSIFIDHSLGAKFIDCPFIGNYNCQCMGNGLNCQFKGNINWPHMGNDSFPIHGPFIIGQSLEMIQLAIHGPFSLPIDWGLYSLPIYWEL
jgi:hypothetical protein